MEHLTLENETLKFSLHTQKRRNEVAASSPLSLAIFSLFTLQKAASGQA